MQKGVPKLNYSGMQAEIACHVILEDPDTIKYVAGFAVSYWKDQSIVAAVVMNAKTLEIVEKKTLATKTPMNYVPGLIAFREGPPILKLFYDLEYTPDIILVQGQGINHPQQCGLASYVGAELDKSCIGITDMLTEGVINNEDIILVEGEPVGKKVITKQHAIPLAVSPGHRITIETAAKLVLGWVRLPHKLPEPLHVAHRIAKKTADQLRESQAPTMTMTATLIPTSPFSANETVEA